MVKIFIKFLILMGIIFLIINLLSITPMWHYYIGTKTRKSMIKKLKENCLDADTVYLIKTYSDIYNDKNASQCWNNYRRQCYKHKENNLTLKIPIKCPSY